MKDRIEHLIRDAVRVLVARLQIEIADSFGFDLAISKDNTHGDFASNVPFKLAKIAKLNPKQIAEDIVLILNQKLDRDIDRFEVGAGGFLNIYLSKKSLASVLTRVRQENHSYGQSTPAMARKALVEFVSANPTGPLTIAHGRQAVIGDVLVRILKAAGHQVASEYYLNDSGRQMNLLGASLLVRYKQSLGLAAELPEDGYKGEYLTQLAVRLKELKGSDLLQLPEAEDICREFAKDEIMRGIKIDLERVRVSFDQYFSEKTLYTNGEIQKSFEDLKANGHLFESEGALWFRSTAFGDDKDRVIQKSSGELTYLAPDIAYHRAKFERGFNWIIDLMGPDHHGYIPRLKAACAALGHNPDQLDVRIVQLATLYRNGEPVRMSTRAGEFVTLHELVEEAGVDATRYFFVMRKVDSHLDFDIELAKQKSQDNPVYYLQYAHARISSILRNAQKPIPEMPPLDRLVEPAEVALIKMITDFPSVIQKAADWLEPYRIADYLRELSALFHKFYASHRVLSEDEDLTNARLFLVDAARIVLRNGLELLGISQPESM